MGIAEQLGMFFPKVASAARTQKRAEKAKKGNGKDEHEVEKVSVAAPPASTTSGTLPRELLWQDDVAMFLVKVPETAEYKAGLNGGNDYLRFYRPVKGGVVNVHVYHPTGNPGMFAGEKVACRARVWSKKLEGGREYLYIDLFVLPRETEVGRFPTHEWRVVQGRDQIIPKGMKNVHHFPTPEPLDGAIVVGEVLPKFK